LSASEQAPPSDQAKGSPPPPALTSGRLEILRLTPPFAALSLAAHGIGHSLFPLDSDGPARRVSPIVKVGDRTIASFALATTLASGARPSIAARIDDTGLCGVMIPWRAYASCVTG
jgi:hypothetical protein